MRIPILVALGYVLIWQGTAAAAVDGAEEQPEKDGDPSGICQRVGKQFCKEAPCIVTGTAKDSFECDCGPNMYYDAFESQCQHRDSCDVRPCDVGTCKDNEGKIPRKCDCTYFASGELTPECEISEQFREACKRRKARAAVKKNYHVECVCEEGKYLKDNNPETVCEDKPPLTPCEANQVRDADEEKCVPRRECTENEKRQCRVDEICTFNGTHPACHCGEHQRLLNNVCTDKCSTNRCYEDLAVCKISFGKDTCVCNAPLTKSGAVVGPKCTLDTFLYVVTFQTNDTAYRKFDTCTKKLPELRKAMRTLYGKKFADVEMIECGKDVTIRLKMRGKQDPAILKRLHQCTFPDAEICIFPPALYVRKDSVKDIKEEDLCQGALKDLLGFPEGPQVCMKDRDEYVLKCKDGFTAHSKQTTGRVTLWLCKENNGGATVKASAFTAMALAGLAIRFSN